MVSQDVKELDEDIARIEAMIRSQLNGVEGKTVTIDWLVREVLPYHLYLHDSRHFRNIDDAARDIGQLLQQSLVE